MKNIDPGQILISSAFVAFWAFCQMEKEWEAGDLKAPRCAHRGPLRQGHASWALGRDSRPRAEDGRLRPLDPERG